MHSASPVAVGGRAGQAAPHRNSVPQRPPMPSSPVALGIPDVEDVVERRVHIIWHKADRQALERRQSQGNVIEFWRQNTTLLLLSPKTCTASTPPLSFAVRLDVD